MRRAVQEAHRPIVRHVGQGVTQDVLGLAGRPRERHVEGRHPIVAGEEAEVRDADVPDEVSNRRRIVLLEESGDRIAGAHGQEDPGRDIRP